MGYIHMYTSEKYMYAQKVCNYVQSIIVLYMSTKTCMLS